MATASADEARFRIFLNQCKNLALEKNSNNFWRFEKYIDYLDNMLEKLQVKHGDTIDINILTTYRKDVGFLKGIVEAEKQTTLENKLAATRNLVAPSVWDLGRNVQQQAQSISSSIADKSNNISPPGTSPQLNQVKALTKAQYTRDIRKQLLGQAESDDEDGESTKSGLRLRKAGDALETGSADIDAVLKHHHDMQEKLAEQFLQLTRNLKENAAAAGSVIRDDRKTLERLHDSADQNFDELAKEAERLAYFAYKSCDWWVWGMLLIVCFTFVGMVVFMRIFPKPRYY